MSVTRRRFGVLRTLAIAVAVVLLALDVAGLFVSLANPALTDEPVQNGQRYTRPPAAYRDVVTISHEALLAGAPRQPGETDGAYAIRQTSAVHHAVAHYWRDEGIGKYHLRVPVTENYLLYAASFVRPHTFEKYEFYDYRKAVERGVGFSSQLTVILTRLLEAQGIPTRIVLEYTHTFALAQVDKARDIWWIADPDYGVVAPYTLEQTHENPSLLVPLYEQAGFTREYVQQWVVPVHAWASYRVVEGSAGYLHNRSAYEPASYVLIWVIPVVLLAAAIWRPARTIGR